MQTISPEQLKGAKQKRDDLLFINTLPEKYFDDTKIDGAINIPQDQEDFAEKVQQHANDKQQPVIVYCASESCDSSHKAAEKLERAGFNSVYDLEVGAKGWQRLCASEAGC